MRTTVVLPDELMRAAKVRAAMRGESLKELFERAVAAEIGRPRSTRRVSFPIINTVSPSGDKHKVIKVKADGSRKMSYKETRELAELPERIAALEQEQAKINERLEDPKIYQAEPQEAQRISLRLTEIDDELMALLERWEALEQ